MISSILTVLYLARDTVHRWFARLSSPVSRVLVVYFLTLSALAGLGSYVITLNLVRDELLKRGGDVVVANVSGTGMSKPVLPSYREISETLNADSYLLSMLGRAEVEQGASLCVYTYDFSRQNQMLPLLSRSGIPTVLQDPEHPKYRPGPIRVRVDGYPIDGFVKNLPAGHPLAHVFSNDAVAVIPPDRLPPQMGARMMSNPLTTLVIRVRVLESSLSIDRIERYLRTLYKYEHLSGNIFSGVHLLRRLDTVMDKQMQCRLAFCLGITTIVGILLTALAGMEYRQNEYIYTLMKSFGIHPFMLVGAFIIENILIVGVSFAAAITTFMYFQRIIVTQVLKLGNYTLTLEEVHPEIMYISYALIVCVLISAIPILVAANRRIGYVLK